MNLYEIKNNDFHKNLNRFLELIDSDENSKKTINKILKFCLELYDADRAYIFEINKKSQIGIISYEICKNGIKVLSNNLYEVNTNDIKKWISRLEKNKTFNIDNLGSLKQKQLNKNKSKKTSHLLNVSFNNDNIIAFLCLDNPRINADNNIPIRIINYVLKASFIEIKYERCISDNKKELGITSKEDIYLKTFGESKIITHYGCFPEKSIISQQSYLFFIFLLINKNNPIGIDEITKAIWSNQDVFEPYGYVRNLAFRTKKFFKDYIKMDIIIAYNGSYIINPKINITTDFGMLEYLYENNQNLHSKKEKINNYEKMFNLYQGTMLCNYQGEIWLANIACRYKNMYIEIITDYLKLLLEQKLYKKAHYVAGKAISIYNDVPIFHYYEILIYNFQNKKVIATEYLNKIKVIFSNDEYKKIYKIIKKER